LRGRVARQPLGTLGSINHFRGGADDEEKEKGGTRVVSNSIRMSCPKKELDRQYIEALEREEIDGVGAWTSKERSLRFSEVGTPFSKRATRAGRYARKSPPVPRFGEKEIS